MFVAIHISMRCASRSKFYIDACCNAYFNATQIAVQIFMMLWYSIAIFTMLLVFHCNFTPLYNTIHMEYYFNVDTRYLVTINSFFYS